MHVYKSSSVFIKRFLLVIITSIGFLLCFFLALSYFFNYMEVVDTYYPTLLAAKASGVVGKGKWVPPILPPSASDIHERHDIDTNEVWIKFRFDLCDLAVLLKQLEELSTKDISSLKLWGLRTPRWWHKRRPDWWPALLSQKSITNATDNFPFIVALYKWSLNYGDVRTVYYRGYFFLNSKTNTGYYYCEGERWGKMGNGGDGGRRRR